METETKAPWLLTDEEGSKLAMRLLQTRGRFGATEEEVAAVLDWANGTRLMDRMLDLVISGRVVVDVRQDGEVVFSNPK